MKASFGYDLGVDVPAPPSAVWARVASYERDGEWREGVTMRCEPPGLVREGTRTFETLRFLGDTHEKVAVVDRVEPGRGFRFRGEAGDFEGTRRVEPTAAGSHLRVTLRVDVTGALALVAPLLGWLFRRRVRRDLERLRAQLATAAPAIAQRRAA